MSELADAPTAPPETTHVLAWMPAELIPWSETGWWIIYTAEGFEAGIPPKRDEGRCFTDLPQDASQWELANRVEWILGHPVTLARDGEGLVHPGHVTDPDEPGWIPTVFYYVQPDPL